MPASNQPFQSGPSLSSFFITLVLGMGVFTYIAFSALARDALWFWPYFEETPSGILVRCYGEQVVAPTDSPEFAEITRLVNERLSGDKQWQEMTISDQTFEDYKTDPSMVVLEMYYSRPVDVHTGTAMFIDLSGFLIPLEGRFAEQSLFFGVKNDRFTGGAVHTADTQPLIDYVFQSGLCTKK